MEIKEIQAKSILVPSKIPDIDFVINPYTGCGFGCTYCYASFMSRYVGKDINDWGGFVYPKVNAQELLKEEVVKLKNKGRGKNIFLSSVTDPYQGLEAKYQLTRKCLEVLADYGFEGNISILTKSDLILRDVDVLKKLKNIEIGLTITSVDDKISRYFERFAPNVSQRFKALKELNKLGFKTYVFVGPLLPHFVDQPEMLEKLAKEIKAVGTTDIYVEQINLSKYILDRLKSEMSDLDPKILQKFYSTKNDKKYRTELNELVKKILSKYVLRMRLGDVINHKDA